MEFSQVRIFIYYMPIKNNKILIKGRSPVKGQ